MLRQASEWSYSTSEANLPDDAVSSESNLENLVHRWETPDEVSLAEEFATSESSAQREEWYVSFTGVRRSHEVSEEVGWPGGLERLWLDSEETLGSLETDVLVLTILGVGLPVLSIAAAFVTSRGSEESSAAIPPAGPPPRTLGAIVALGAYRYYNGFLAATWVPYLIAKEGESMMPRSQTLF